MTGLLGSRSAPAGAAALPAGFVVMWSSGFIGARLCGDAAPVVTVMVWRFALVALGLSTVLWLGRRFHRRRTGRGAARRPTARGRGLSAHAVLITLTMWAKTG